MAKRTNRVGLIIAAVAFVVSLIAVAVALTVALTADAPISSGHASGSQSPAAVPSISPSPSPSTPSSMGPECPTHRCVTVTVSGDMLFHTNLWKHFERSEPVAGSEFDFSELLAGQAQYLDQSDLSICQMETPLAAFGGPYRQYPIFSIPPEVAQTAADVGYQVCTTASNHSVDQGTEGLERTLDMLEQAGLQHTGTYRSEADADEVLVVETEAGVNIGIVTGTFSLNGLVAEHDWQVDSLDRERLIARAEQARKAGADLVIAGLHVGTEYQNNPNSQQIELNRALIDSGEFDFVYNHHAHAVQPLEKYEGKWIAYNLGNSISVTSSYYAVNNEFLTVRVQFAQYLDGDWETSDVSWVPATNRRDGEYRWCSVAKDAPDGVCQSEATDREIRNRVAAIVNDMGADTDGAHPWLITEEQP